jgi:hypothetical protein
VLVATQILKMCCPLIFVGFNHLLIGFCTAFSGGSSTFGCYLHDREMTVWTQKAGAWVCFSFLFLISSKFWAKKIPNCKTVRDSYMNRDLLSDPNFERLMICLFGHLNLPQMYMRFYERK